MKTRLSEFASQHIGDREAMAEYKQSRNLSTFFGFVAFLSLAVAFPIYLYKITVISLPISLPFWSSFGFFVLFALTGYIIRSGRKNGMDIDSDAWALHKMALSLKSYENGDYEDAVEAFGEFADETGNSWNSLFSDSKQELIDNYESRIESLDDPEEEMNETFEDFMEALVENLQDEETLASTVERVEDQSEAETNNARIIRSSFATVGINRFVVVSSVLSIIGLVVSFRYDPQWGAIFLAAISPIMSALSSR